MADSDRDRTEDSDRPTGDIKVTDRRLFGKDGELRRELDDNHAAAADEAPTARTPAAVEAPAGEGEQGSGEGFEHRPVEEPQGVDFAMLVSGMAQSALIYLGEIPNPGTGEPEVNLEQARLQIDLLDVLRVKCRGNLSREEEGLLDRMLYQLRMLFVARSGGPGPTPGGARP